MTEYPFRPIIIIGAARSGTKLLRDTLGIHPETAIVPYDVNYVWRLGNDNYPHDELSPELATDSIRKQIISHFQKTHSKGRPFLIEKTVSNTLRVPFVERIFPDAYYIHLLRNGADVIESSYRQWTAKPDWRYILQKARSFPLLQSPRYAISYAKNALEKLFSSDKKTSRSTWGVRYKGIDEDLVKLSILEICAIQWHKSLTIATKDFKEISTERVYTLRYEDFVQKPKQELEKIANWFGMENGPYLNASFEHISLDNVGKGSGLNIKEKGIIEAYLSKH